MRKVQSCNRFRLVVLAVIKANAITISPGRSPVQADTKVVVDIIGIIALTNNSAWYYATADIRPLKENIGRCQIGSPFGETIGTPLEKILCGD
ncbi:hypothetical protein D9M68_979100 [compost metagenome]